ncbi:hypothetical protein ES703_03827 [subsurface metagenome]
MALELEKEIAEYLLMPAGSLPRLFTTPLRDEARYFPLDAGGKGDEPIMVQGEELPIHPRFIVETLEVGLGGKLDEIMIADLVSGKQNEVVGVFIARLP